MKFKFNRFKTLNPDSFSKEVKKCLSPVSKKISLYYINSNIKAIKSSLNIFNKKYSSQKHKNTDIIENNSRFKEYMDKYYEYKKFFKEKEKHKTKKKKKGTIDLLIDNYIKKGYKLPNLEKNIFHVNPLNDSGNTIQKYFDEYIAKNKKLVTGKEKNFFYLYKLQDQIKTEKYKEKKDLQMLLNLSNYNSGNSGNVASNNNQLNTNYSNIFLKKYFNEIKKPCLSDNEKNLEENNIENIDANINNVNFEQDEDFAKLNEYEQNNIRQLIKDSEENKKYKSFIEKALSDKKYFDIIDNDNVELDKKIELKTLSPIKHDNKKLFKLKIKNDKKNININHNNLDESSYSSEHDEFSNESKEKEFKVTHNKKFSTLLYNDKISKFKTFNFPQKKNNFISINKKVISEKDTNINPNINDKKLSFSKSQEEMDDSINKKIKRDNKTKKTHFLPGNKFLKKYNFPKSSSSKIIYSHSSKTKSLNFLFEKINTGKTPDKKTLLEYKNYFLKNKKMSEHDLNEFINRDYEPKDFYNLVNSVDAKIQGSDIENKWRKNYLKIGKLEGRRKLLEEEKKQDNYISHLLQYFILAKYGKYKLYQFQ